MVDLYLQAMMNGLVSFKKKDRFDELIENDIKDYVDSLVIEEDPIGSQLVSVKMKRSKLIEELKEDIKMPELGEFLDQAFAFIKGDGLRYLGNTKFEVLSLEFQRASEIVETYDPDKEIPLKLCSLLEISDESMNSIFGIAIASFKDERYQDSLAIFVLLTTLEQTNSDYWFRLGIAAQKCGNLSLALRAYPICLDIKPDLIGAELFSAECHLIQGNQNSALQAMMNAKRIVENLEVEPIWVDLLAELEKKEEIAA